MRLDCAKSEIMADTTAAESLEESNTSDVVRRRPSKIRIYSNQTKNRIKTVRTNVEVSNTTKKFQMRGLECLI